MAKAKIFLSACLTGKNCVYDGSNNFHPFFAELSEKGQAVLFCPEALGGLKVPHPPSEISKGDGGSVLKGAARVLSRDGRDVTPAFLKGAEKSLQRAKKFNVKKAVMKARSPSCGCGVIYDGTFSKKLVRGFGVTAALLKENGIVVMSDEEYLKKTSRVLRAAGRGLKTKNSKLVARSSKRKYYDSKK